MGDTTGKQSTRQAARRAALEAQSAVRREREARDRRCAALGLQVAIALREGAAAAAAHEQRAAAALRALVDDERLTMAEALAWCAGTLTPREAARLRRLPPGHHPGR